MMNTSQEHANLKRRFLNTHYDKQYTAWVDKTDDRKLFCNIIDRLNEAIDAMQTVENNTIWVAFNNLFKEDCSRLEDIKERFTTGTCKDAK